MSGWFDEMRKIKKLLKSVCLYSFPEQSLADLINKKEEEKEINSLDWNKDSE